MRIEQKIELLFKKFGNQPFHVRTHRPSHPGCLGLIVGWVIGPIFDVPKWLWIEEKDEHWTIYILNAPERHNLRLGPVLGADISKKDGSRKMGPGNLQGAWKSALSLWPANKKEAPWVFKSVIHEINIAYETFSKDEDQC